MNEEQLSTLMEKVLTLNVNANTNIDVQAIINNYIMYKSIASVSIAAMFFIFFMSALFTVFYVVLRALNLAQKEYEAEETMDLAKKILSNFNEKAEALEWKLRNKD
jgi:hypothetical protein